MSSPPTGKIVVGHHDEVLGPSPIPQGWIIDGNPVARNVHHSTSKDGMATTVVWECSPGRFNWFYGQDETIHIVHGDVTLTEPNGAVQRIGPGSIVFFPAGSQVMWEVHSQVRKVALFRRTLPRSAALAKGLSDTVRRLLGYKAKPVGMNLDH